MDLTRKQRKIIRASIKEFFAQRTAEEASATEVLAIKITFEEPAPDSTFEILFMTREKADKYQKQRIMDGQWATSQDIIEEISFAEGVALAKRSDCSGGYWALQDARRFQKINPVVQTMGLEI